MGWANCGYDSKGRPIGYAHEATCDHPECSKVIDRGISYACGDMHGADEVSCEGYFCDQHKMNTVEAPVASGRSRVWVCDACAKALLKSGEYFEDEEGDIRPKETNQCAT